MPSHPRQTRRSSSVAAPRSTPPGRHGLALPLLLSGGILGLTLLPRIRENAALTWAFWGAAGVLLVWMASLTLRRHLESSTERDGPSVFTIALTRPRAQHYVQSVCQFSVYLYWGWFWPPVYDYMPLLAGQLLFAYAFDLLLAWSRRQPYQLGMGPFPIVFSTNLFLWFKDDWFAFQFAVIAVGFLGKAFVQWERDGRKVHIFNPSAFTLALFSLALLATGTTNLTWAQEINSTFGLGPHIYVVLFTIGLVVMYFFAITPVTAMAAATLFGASALFSMVSGVPYFVDTEIPAAVFLGLHLLVTDPSTSPRTAAGRAVFGVLYGLGVFALYAILGGLGLPTFYDKLLVVPLLNLTAPAIDRLLRPLGERSILGRAAGAPVIRTANVAFMGVWAVFFLLMTATGRTDGVHTGDSLPFWQQACADGRPLACQRLTRLEASYCADNAGWACNELGLHHVEGQLVEASPERAAGFFARACEARFQAGCVNLLQPDAPVRSDPRPLDLRLLVREGGLNLTDVGEPELYARACRHGWQFACARQTASR